MQRANRLRDELELRMVWKNGGGSSSLTSGGETGRGEFSCGVKAHRSSRRSDSSTCPRPPSLPRGAVCLHASFTTYTHTATFAAAAPPPLQWTQRAPERWRRRQCSRRKSRNRGMEGTTGGRRTGRTSARSPPSLNTRVFCAGRPPERRAARRRMAESSPRQQRSE